MESCLAELGTLHVNVFGAEFSCPSVVGVLLPCLVIVGSTFVDTPFDADLICLLVKLSEGLASFAFHFLRDANICHSSLDSHVLLHALLHAFCTD
jgi:hypothetical protein